MSAPINNYCVCYFSWFFELKVPSDTQLFTKDTTVLEAKMQMAKSFDISPHQITNLFIVPSLKVIHMMERIRKSPEEVKQILREDCTDVTLQTHVIPENYPNSNVFIFFDVQGCPITVLQNFTVNYNVGSYHVIDSTNEEEIALALAKKFVMPRDYIFLKNEAATKICSIFAESKKSFCSGFCEIKFYIMIFGFVTLLSDVVGDFTVAFSFYQTHDFWFMGLVLFFKSLSLIIRTIKMGSEEYKYTTDTESKSFLLRLILCFFHLDIIYEQYCRWKQCDRLPSSNARVQYLLRTLPCFCIKAYAIYFYDRFTLMFILSSLLSLYSLASFYMNPIIHSYPLVRIAFFSPKMPEKALQSVGRLIFNFLDAYWQIVLLVIFAILTRPWGVVIFYFWMVSYRFMHTPEGKHVAFVSGLMDTLYIRRFNFLFAGNFHIEYLEESDEFIYNDYLTVLAENVLKFVKAIVFIGFILYNDSNLRHFAGYNNYSAFTFLSAVIVFILVFVKYLHDISVMDSIMSRVFEFRGSKASYYEDDDAGVVQLQKMELLMEATQIDNAGSERQRVDFMKVYMGQNDTQSSFHRDPLLSNA